MCTLRLSRSPGCLQHDVQDGNTTVHYTLLSASWAVLCYYAEDLRLKLPLQVRGRHGDRVGLEVPPARVTGDWSPNTASSCQQPTALGGLLLPTPTPDPKKHHRANRAGGGIPHGGFVGDGVG